MTKVSKIKLSDDVIFKRNIDHFYCAWNMNISYVEKVFSEKLAETINKNCNIKK